LSHLLGLGLLFAFTILLAFPSFNHLSKQNLLADTSFYTKVKLTVYFNFQY